MLYMSISHQIECSIEACYAADCNNITSSRVTSPAFRPEVIVSKIISYESSKVGFRKKTIQICYFTLALKFKQS